MTYFSMNYYYSKTNTMTQLIKFITFIIILLLGTITHSQAYFQQDVAYKIDVKLDDKTHELNAFETIEYTNNSPQELAFIYFHIWPNAYDNNSTALAKQYLLDSNSELFNIEKRRGYIDQLDFKVDGETIVWEYDKEHIDICKLQLKAPLKPGERITISTPFHVKLPLGVTSRLGHVKQTYQITQWYPKPAVYDQYGWHQMPYLNQGEFYSEFGSFDVSITIPKNYVVGATGDLQNEAELAWLTQIAAKTAKIETFDTKDAVIESSTEFKTLRYTQVNVHDFAWFADKHFNVLKGEIQLPDSDQKVTTWTMFPNAEAALWKNSLEYIGDAVYFYSEKNGNYPYKQCTALHSALSAGGGMEYPNVTVIGNSSNARELEIVIMHEVGHNWFYGILGSNERVYTWMDEGLNSFNEARYMREKYDKEDAFSNSMGIPKKLTKLIGLDDIRYKNFQEITYLALARTNSDQNPSTLAAAFTPMNYGAVPYMKSARTFDYLMSYLGEETFDKAMKKYFEKWKFKHPYPKDLRQVLEEESGEDLSWVFDDLLNTTKKIDYKICKVKDGQQVFVKNKGAINAPILINGVKDGKIVFSEWFNGFDGKKKLELSKKYDVDQVVIDAEQNMLELYRNNNSYRTSGMFRKIEPIKFKAFGLIESSNKTQINFVPTMGWNDHNKFMLGATFYNALFPSNKFEYQITPMYSFGTNDLAGFAKLAYTHYPYNTKAQNISFSVSGKRYAYFNQHGYTINKLKAEVSVALKNIDFKSNVTNRISLNTVRATDFETLFSTTENYNQYYNLNLLHSNHTKKHSYSFYLNNQLNTNFAKVSFTSKYKVKVNKRFLLRMKLFAGSFLYKKDDLSTLYQYNLSGISGYNDYTFDSNLLGRFSYPTNNGFLSSQFDSTQGAFASYTPYGNTDQLVSFNISSTIPYIPKSINLFANTAYFNERNAVQAAYKLNNFAWETGVKFAVFGDTLEVFLPVLMSDGLQNTTELTTSSYLQRIRFSLNLSRINPFTQIKRQLK